jgi:hypothetical protein
MSVPQLSSYRLHNNSFPNSLYWTLVAVAVFCHQDEEFVIFSLEGADNNWDKLPAQRG